LFVAGFSTVFVALGASASAVGALIRFYSNELAIVAGIAIIVMACTFWASPDPVPVPAGRLDVQSR